MRQKAELVPARTQLKLKIVRGEVTMLAKLKNLLKIPFPDPEMTRGYIEAMITRKMNELGTPGNYENNIAFLWLEKPVSFVYSFYLFNFYFNANANHPSSLTQIRDALSQPRSNMHAKGIKLYNRIFKCFTYHQGAKAKESKSQNNLADPEEAKQIKIEEDVRRFFAFKHRFLYKGAEVEMEVVLKNLALVPDAAVAFKVSKLASFSMLFILGCILY